MPTLPRESWPNIRVLHVELWPRDPARIDAGDGEWGEQTLALLDNISQLKVNIVVEFRWMDDCEKFERRYMGKGWRRVGGVE